MSLSDQNRALIERFGPLQEFDDVSFVVSRPTLNRLLDAARAEGRLSPERKEDAALLADANSWYSAGQFEEIERRDVGKRVLAYIEEFAPRCYSTTEGMARRTAFEEIKAVVTETAPTCPHEAADAILQRLSPKQKT